MGTEDDIRSIVLLHGVWSHGAAMLIPKLHLEREYGYDVHLFNYRSLRRTLDENADALFQFIDERHLNDSHLVGHSLGGVVLLRMLARHPGAIGGRVVCLGSPLKGSRAASVLSLTEWGDSVLGRSLTTGVTTNTASDWAHDVCESFEVGVIAGDAPYGVGQFLAGFDGPSDGTVAVAETELEGQTDHLVMRLSHNGLVRSRRAADQIAAFLKRGEFLRDIDSLQGDR